MKKFVLGSVALAAMLATPAMAADMPVKAPVPHRCAMIGAASISARSSVGCSASWTTPLLTQFRRQSGGRHGKRVETNQWFAGGHGGVQYQFGCSPWGNFVFGVEGFWNVTSDSDDEKNLFAARFPGEALRANINEFGGVGIRLGWAWDTWLFTVSGGWAGANIHTGNLATVDGGCGVAGVTWYATAASIHNFTTVGLWA